MGDRGLFQEGTGGTQSAGQLSGRLHGGSATWKETKGMNITPLGTRKSNPKQQIKKLSMLLHVAQVLYFQVLSFYKM